MTPKEVVTGFFTEGYSNKNYDFVMERVAEDYIDHSPAGAKSNSDTVGILKIVAEQFSDLKADVIDIFSEGNMVSSRIRFSGKHTGICMGISPTGKDISFEALENFRVENGKITESWGYWPDKEIEAKLLAE
ncbi:MAG: ester cyclase [Oscillospiraceae bacterium]|nr:ester cyclase [Oscillospiraceae bacterium]